MAREVIHATPSPVPESRTPIPGEASVDLKEFYDSDGYLFLLSQLNGIADDIKKQAFQVPMVTETPYRRYFLTGVYVGMRDFLSHLERLMRESKERQ